MCASRSEEAEVNTPTICEMDLSDHLSSNKNHFNLRFQGSEAKIYAGHFLTRPSLLKERFVKKYRHPDLDKSLSIQRMKQEVRTLAKCKEVGISCPAVYFVDLKTRSFIMEDIPDTITVKNFLFDLKIGMEDLNKVLVPLGTEIGKNVAKMHKSDIMHGDLTTSNMLIKNDQKNSIINGEDFNFYFIDFGLSRKGIVHEDKAVDLYVLERAISSFHPKADCFFAPVLEAYMANVGPAGPAIAQKLKDVQLRGRKRSMVG